jgi:2-C-methyl-D-erythritol 4-phosphate cytidylyltransferase
LGVPVVVRAVQGLLASGVVDHVEVLVRPDTVDAAVRLLAGLPASVSSTPECAVLRVREHVGQRATPRAGDGRSGGCPTVLLHDATRPLTPPALAEAVTAAVTAGHAVAVPVLPLSDTVKRVDDRGLVVGSPDRAGLRVVQTPQAFRADLLDPEALCRVLASAAPVEQAWAAVGEPATTVPGHPLAMPVRSAWERELAAVLATEGSG